MPRSVEKSKPLYSKTQSGVRINIACRFNINTEHIGIYSWFTDGRKQTVTKMLYTSSQDGVQTTVECIFNPKTGLITITSRFKKQCGWKGGASTNPKCTLYLGVVVAERVLSKVFKNVRRMPPNNKGFDFICNRGKKIDVKSSCIRERHEHSDSWGFSIKRNQVVDYFLCIAFDNRKDLNPLHIWLIPSDVINHLMVVSITKSTPDKWAQYELTDKLDSVLACCNIWKGQS